MRAVIVKLGVPGRDRLGQLAGRERAVRISWALERGRRHIGRVAAGIPSTKTGA